MAKIGIIAALDCEITKYIADFSATLMENGFIYHGTFSGHDIYLTLCGVGKVNAAICTQRLIDFAAPDIIINSGVAGGVSDKLHICDLAISDSLTYHDFYPIDVLDKYAPGCSVFPADEKLIELAVRSANEYHKTEPDFRYLVGRIVSGAATVSADVMKKLLAHTTTDTSIAGFAADWKKAFGDTTLLSLLEGK